MILIELTETGDGRTATCALSPAQARRLHESEVVATAPVAGSGERQWRVEARQQVGAVRFDDVGVEILIRPKLPIDRLLFLVGYAYDHKGSLRNIWQDDHPEFDVRAGLLPAVSQILWRQAEHALRDGPLRGYRTVDESSYVIRGRLREADQLHRHHGRILPVEIRHDDFTVDIPENQILLGAISRMLAVPRVDAESKAHLSALRRTMDGVTRPRSGRLPAWRPTRLNRRYHSVLRLAEVIWRSTAPEHGRGFLTGNGFLFNLNTVFEDFVTEAIGEELRRHGGSTRRKHDCHLDLEGGVPMRPDLVWFVDGHAAGVVDAKYKQGKKNDDIYQALAYCSALALRKGHLVYARDDAPRSGHRIAPAGIEIVRHALDLTRPPDDVLAQISRIADEIRSVRPAA